MKLTAIKTKSGLASSTTFLLKDGDKTALFYKGDAVLVLEKGMKPRVDLSVFSKKRRVNRHICETMSLTVPAIRRGVKEGKIIDTSEKVFYSESAEEAGYVFYERGAEKGDYILLSPFGATELWRSTRDPEGHVMTIKRLSKSYLTFIKTLEA